MKVELIETIAHRHEPLMFEVLFTLQLTQRKTTKIDEGSFATEFSSWCRLSRFMFVWCIHT